MRHVCSACSCLQKRNLALFYGPRFKTVHRTVLLSGKFPQKIGLVHGIAPPSPRARTRFRSNFQAFFSDSRCVMRCEMRLPLLCPRLKIPFDLLFTLAAIFRCTCFPSGNRRKLLILGGDRLARPFGSFCPIGKCSCIFPFGHLYYTTEFPFVKTLFEKIFIFLKFSFNYHVDHAAFSAAYRTGYRTQRRFPRAPCP